MLERYINFSLNMFAATPLTTRLFWKHNMTRHTHVHLHSQHTTDTRWSIYAAA